MTAPKPETSEEGRNRRLRELEGKNVANYSVLLGAWINTRMERDKTLITLSAAGVALLVTILTAIGVAHRWEIILYGVAFVCFVTTIVSSLRIYQLNSEHIEKDIRGEGARDPRLKSYDRRSFAAFMIGILMTIVIGVVAAVGEVAQSRNLDMPEDKKVPAVRRDYAEVEKHSLDGLHNLRPEVVPVEQTTTETATSPQLKESEDSAEDQPAN